MEGGKEREGDGREERDIEVGELGVTWRGRSRGQRWQECRGAVEGLQGREEDGRQGAVGQSHGEEGLLSGYSPGAQTARCRAGGHMG
jgi:hypothetical protein